MSNIPEYVTADNKLFKTTLELGDVNPKQFDLDILERAESRVLKGTNRSLRTALNSLGGLKKGSKKKTVNSAMIRDIELDEYGLDPALYSEAQINYIVKKVKEFRATYNHDTPFENETIIEMAKNRLKTAEVEAKMLNSDDEKLINQKTKLRTDFSSMAKDLKIKPDQKNEQDKSKSRTSLAEMVLRYESRRKTGRLETDEKTEEMRKRLAAIRAMQLDPKFEDKSE